MARQVIFTHTGTVTHGEKVGRTIGFPTLNIDKIPPFQIKKGVYAGICTIDQQKYTCAIYFGPRLIFGEKKDCFEAYVYNFNQEVYGKVVTFELLEFIRPPLPFTSLADLKTQLEKDKIEAEKALQINLK